MLYTAFSDDHSLLSDAVECLSGYKTTLETLHLDLSGRYLSGRQDALRVNGGFLTKPIPSLRGFPVLRHVFLDTRLIYSSVDGLPEDHDILIQLLPPSIVSLRLADNMSSRTLVPLTNGLLRLAEAASQGQFPRLKKVTCDTGERLDDCSVSEMFASAGVDFGYDTWPFSDEIPRRSIPYRPGSSMEPMSSPGSDVAEIFGDE